MTIEDECTKKYEALLKQYQKLLVKVATLQDDNTELINQLHKKESLHTKSSVVK